MCKYELHCAHFLPRVPAGHKCAQLHGHSYWVEIHVSGPIDDKMGWIMDFDTVDAIFQKEVFSRIDHTNLNTFLPNPTCELLAIWIGTKLTPHMPGLKAIHIRETSKVGIVYEL